MDGEAAILLEVARRSVWWQPPEQTIERRTHFLCHLMQQGTADDVRAVRRILGDDAFRAALPEAPPGILDARSWNFWHRFLFGSAPPPLPTRPLPP